MYVRDLDVVSCLVMSFFVVIFKFLSSSSFWKNFCRIAITFFLNVYLDIYRPGCFCGKVFNYKFKSLNIHIGMAIQVICFSLSDSGSWCLSRNLSI